MSATLAVIIAAVITALGGIIAAFLIGNSKKLTEIHLLVNSNFEAIRTDLKTTSAALSTALNVIATQKATELTLRAELLLAQQKLDIATAKSEGGT